MWLQHPIVGSIHQSADKKTWIKDIAKHQSPTLSRTTALAHRLSDRWYHHPCAKSDEYGRGRRSVQPDMPTLVPTLKPVMDLSLRSSSPRCRSSRRSVARNNQAVAWRNGIPILDYEGQFVIAAFLLTKHTGFVAMAYEAFTWRKLVSSVSRFDHRSALEPRTASSLVSDHRCGLETYRRSSR
jgi:hypothetical protein